jgi:hypothetical protein
MTAETVTDCVAQRRRGAARGRDTLLEALAVKVKRKRRARGMAAADRQLMFTSASLAARSSFEFLFSTMHVVAPPRASTQQQ